MNVREWPATRAEGGDGDHPTSVKCDSAVDGVEGQARGNGDDGKECGGELGPRAVVVL